LVGCAEDGNTVDTMRFRVTISNVSTAYDYPVSGAFTTPVDATSPAPIGPGEAYESPFGAAPGARVSFATMFVHSNDLFYGPGADGIALFDDEGAPISGDVTSQVMLWDAGTEANEEPGVGENQAPRQSGPNTGPADGDDTVRLVSDAYTYPPVEDVIQVSITHEGGHEFTLRIENVSTATTLRTSGGDELAVPLAPGVFVIHEGANPLLEVGSADPGEGLEALAEDGDPAELADSLAARTGLTSPLAPGAWAVHASGTPIFAEGSPDTGSGLEALAEDGDSSALANALAGHEDVLSAGAFDTPDGATEPGPLPPGSSYSFEIEAFDGDRLSFATMLVKSNDLFFAPGGTGLALFDASGAPISGDVTADVALWDAGTDANQWPGAGPDQPMHQSGPDTGAADPDDTVRPVDDGHTYPPVDEIATVTIMPVVQ